MGLDATNEGSLLSLPCKPSLPVGVFGSRGALKFRTFGFSLYLRLLIMLPLSVAAATYRTVMASDVNVKMSVLSLPRFTFAFPHQRRVITTENYAASHMRLNARIALSTMAFTGRTR